METTANDDMDELWQLVKQPLTKDDELRFVELLARPQNQARAGDVRNGDTLLSTICYARFNGIGDCRHQQRCIEKLLQIPQVVNTAGHIDSHDWTPLMYLIYDNYFYSHIIDLLKTENVIATAGHLSRDECSLFNIIFDYIDLDNFNIEAVMNHDSLWNCFKGIDKYGNNILHRLVKYDFGKRSELVDKYMDQFKHHGLFNQQNLRGTTPFQVAINHANLNYVNLFILHGAQIGRVVRKINVADNGATTVALMLMFAGYDISEMFYYKRSYNDDPDPYLLPILMKINARLNPAKPCEEP